jgi:hypothetical protein
VGWWNPASDRLLWPIVIVLLIVCGVLGYLLGAL